MPVMTKVPSDCPLWQAWEAYKKTAEYANTRHWARFDLHLDGALWAAFEEGWRAALKEAPSAQTLAAYGGIPVAVDPSLPPSVVEFRDNHGKMLGRLGSLRDGLRGGAAC